MKPYITLLVLLFPVIVFTGGCNDEIEKPAPVPQWERTDVYIKEPYVHLTDIDFFSNDFGVICGSSGTIIITENGGNDWQVHHVPFSGVLLCVSVLIEDVFYTGSSILYKNFFELVNASFGPAITGIHFFDSETGLIIKGDYIYKTTDGGKSWDEENYLRSSRSLQFIADSVGYIYGGFTLEGVNYGVLYKTENRGNNWIDLSTQEVSDWEILAMHFINKDTGFIANYNREFYTTHDGGITWIKRGEILPSKIFDMVFLSKNVGYGIGYPENGILKTTDGGTTWSWDYKNDFISVSAIAKTPDNKKLVAVGRDHVILMKNL